MNQPQTEMTKKELREFGLITGAIVAVLFGLLLPWLFNFAWPQWPWIVTGVLWFLGLLFPIVLKPVYRVWMAFGGVMGWINTRLILGILFYLIFLPVGLVMKLFGKDPMARKLNDKETTYRVLSHVHDKERMRRPF